MKSTIIKITLWVIIIFLAYFGLYGNITNEIHVRKVMDERKSENIQRLKDLREVQLEYKRQNGTYTEHPDSLLHFLFNTDIELYDISTARADAQFSTHNIDSFSFNLDLSLSSFPLQQSVSWNALYIESYPCATP